MADRSIIVKIGANVQGLVNGLKTADQAAQDWGNKTQSYVQKNEQHIDRLSKGFGLVGGALTGLAVLAVKSFADFDSAMSSVQAATMETADNMGLLRDAALDAGARTVYSATEAAGAIEELAKAGVSTADILGGGLDGALDLAASGAIDVGDAAEIAATAMTQFGLGGEDVTHIADLLAAGAGKAQGGVGDLGMALKQAGLVADQTGLSIEETTGGLAAFASAGLIGSDAGTSFKTMLQRLTPQSAEAKKEMDRLGISAYDAQGNFIGLANFAGNLQNAMRDLTPEQRNASMSIIFGSDAVRAANVLYEQGAKGIQDWTAAVDDQGYAAEQAATRMDNLKGDFENLSGSIETALIGMGEGANGPLRSLVQTLSDVVNSFNGMSDGAKQATLALVGGGGLVLLGVAGLGKMTVAVSNTLDSLKSMGVITEATAGRIASGLGSAVKVVGALGAAYGAAALAAQALGKESDPLSAQEWQASLLNIGGAADLASVKIEGVGGEVYGLGDAFDRLTNPGTMARFDDFSGNFLHMNSSADLLTDQFESMGQALADLYASDPDMATEKFNDVLSVTGGTTEQLLDLMPAYKNALLDADNAQKVAASSTGEAASAQETYAAGMADGTATVDQYTDALKEMIKAQSDAAGVVMDLWSAQNQLEQAYADATKALTDNGATLDVTTEKGRANREALMGISEAGWDVIESMQANGATQAELQGQIQATRDRFVAAAQAFGMSAEQANALADQLNLIPTAVTSVVRVNTDQADKDLEAFRQRQSSVTLRIQARVDADPSYSPATAPAQIRRASGGAVYGPGTGTSDSVPARLSTGEHVLTASDVTKLGGQGAVYGLRAAIQSGQFKAYAGGGAVAPVRQYVAPYVAPPNVSASSPLDASALASAMSGMSFVLSIDGQPVRAIAHATAVGVVGNYRRGRSR